MKFFWFWELFWWREKPPYPLECMCCTCFLGYKKGEDTFYKRQLWLCGRQVEEGCFHSLESNACRWFQEKKIPIQPTYTVIFFCFYPIFALDLQILTDILHFLKCFIYFWQRERDRAWAGEGQRDRETQNPKQALGSELSAQSWTWGSGSQTARSWLEPKSRVGRSTDCTTQVPRYFAFLNQSDFFFCQISFVLATDILTYGIAYKAQRSIKFH